MLYPHPLHVMIIHEYLSTLSAIYLLMKILISDILTLAFSFLFQQNSLLFRVVR